MREWCNGLQHPCVIHDGYSILSISQPSSTIISLILCAMYIISAFVVAHLNVNLEVCRTYYVDALYVWAVALLFATCSYQAYTYQIQCQDRPDACIERVGSEVRVHYAADDNWVAIIYLVLQLCGHHLLVVGDAYRVGHVVPTKIACGVITVAFVLFVLTVRLHRITALYLASLIAAAPSFACQIWYNWRLAYAPRLLLCWSILATSFGVYTLMVAFDDASARWRTTGVWFNENDALHLLLYPYGPLLAWASRTSCDRLRSYPLQSAQRA